MTATTQTLAEFLLARILEDEEAAAHSDGGLIDFAWFNKPRVLAECEAKRRIVALHSQEYPHRMYGCKTCREWEEPDWPCSTLRLLAQPYADHEDFREEWRA